MAAGVGGYFLNQAAARRGEKKREQARLVREFREKKEAFEQCTVTIRDVLRKLQEIDSQTDVGLTLFEYRDLIQETQVEYDRAQRTSLHISCTSRVDSSVRESMDLYGDALDHWENCIDNFLCDTDDSDFQLQLSQYWVDAGLAADRAENSLRNLDPGSTPPSPTT